MIKSNNQWDTLIEDILIDADGGEQLWAFRQALEDECCLPREALVIGEPVTALAIDYDGNERRGLTARCRREDGSEHVIAACDLFFPRGTTAARCIAAYRRWLGIEPYPGGAVPRKAKEDDLDLAQDLALVVLAVKGNSVSCRVPGKGGVTLRSTRFWDVVPGELLTVTPRKKWRRKGRLCLSGEIKARRLDVAALDLAPLALEDEDLWDPKEHYWGKPPEAWAEPIIRQGPRPAYRMERVVPGDSPDDPILEAVERKEAGDYGEARRRLMDLLEADLRCLDAHAHLGQFAFAHNPAMAIRHFEAGVRIGELSLGEDFHGLLPWGHVENRPFLRCLYGYGLCLRRLGRFNEAEEIFTRLLWLNPADNQGARFELCEAKERRASHA
jgi:hypothetical protein